MSRITVQPSLRLNCLSGLVVVSISTGCPGQRNDSSGSTDTPSSSSMNPTTTDGPTTTLADPTTGAPTTSTSSTDGPLGTTGGTIGDVSPSSTSGGTEGVGTAGSSTTGGTPPCEFGEGLGDGKGRFLWVSNSDQGTVSKIDTQKVVELARYRSGPFGGRYADNPSRTAVSIDGRFVIVNNRESGYATVIAANIEDCADKNGNGIIETSKAPDDILPWMSDECVRWSTKLPIEGSLNSGPRGVIWSPGEWDKDLCQFVNQKVWVGYLPFAGTAHMARLDGETGVVETTVSVPNWKEGYPDYGPYTAALDRDWNVWFTGVQGELFRINTSNGDTIARWNPPKELRFYGMTVDPDGNPWFGGCAGPVSTFDQETEQFTAIEGTFSCHRGLAADKLGNIWVASNGPCGVVQIDRNTKKLKQFITLPWCSTPIGVSVDDEGFVWIVDQFLGASKIDPANPMDVKFLALGGEHDLHSDMTGGQLKSVILPP